MAVFAHLNDEELVLSWRSAPDGGAAREYLDELFSRHTERVALWCLRVLGDRDAAADAAQNVFLKAWRGLDQFRGEARFSSWLYSIARNECHSYIRARAVIRETSDEEAIYGAADERTVGAHEQMERDSETRVQWRLAEATLTPLEFEVLALHFGEGEPVAAISQKLGLTNATGAKAVILRGRRKIELAARRWQALKNRQN